jgi:energy-coupling factor transporter ATP-binding protein EcfA2
LRLATFLTGKQLLIVGPSSAGKTKFAQYLRLGLLDPEGKREMTYAVTEWPTFVIQMGQHGLILNIRRAVDTPGQVGPLQQASLVGKHRPHLLIIVLDCTKTVENSSQWLALFASRLDTVLRFNWAARRRLTNLMVLLNKRDKVGGRKPVLLTEAVRRILKDNLSVVLSASRAAAVPILECVSVQSPLGTTLIDQVIAELVRQLVE